MRPGLPLSSARFAAAAVLSLSAAGVAAAPALADDAPLTIVIHGGAGALEPGRYTQEQEAAFHAKLEEALQAGYGVLEEGGAALDAVTAAITIMEDSPLFNAGKGAVFTFEGKNELDASIMDGRDLNAGAVAGVTRTKNPILAARAVMEQSVHVMFSGPGADGFAESVGLELVEPAYFRTENRWDSYRRALERFNKSEQESEKSDALTQDEKHGTVGAVAIDKDGNIAAGTSTGGMTLKRHGRIGDSPIIGAGTYADNESCGVSATGHGEFFIRATIARDVCSRVAAGATIAEAADAEIHEQLTGMGSTGGVITLDAKGNHAFSFNTSGMFRGVLTEGQAPVTAIYGRD